MLERIISGGQTGADFGGLLAAEDEHILTGGWMPKGFLTEDGPHPEFAERFGMEETPGSSYYPVRTRLNVRDADLTVWFGATGTAGYYSTKTAHSHYTGKGEMLENPGAEDLALAIRALPARILNVAGNRESKNPGLAEAVRKTVREAIVLLRAWEE